MKRSLFITLALTLTLSGAGLARQPGDSPQPPSDRASDRRAGDQPPADREGLKNFLTRRLEEQRRRLEASERALKALEEGTDPAKVRSEIDSGGGGRRGGGDRRPDRSAEGDEESPRDSGPPTAEQREQLLRFLEEIAPRMGARMRQLSAERPERAALIIGRLRGKLEDLRSLRQRDPELFALKVAEMQGAYGVMEAGRRLREASKTNAASEEVRTARADLKNAIGLHFDQQLAVQQHEVKRLTERLERLQGQIKERQDGRDRVIERQVDDVANRAGSDSPGDHKKNRSPPE